MRERILLCKPKMSGRELDFIKAALAEDWAVPMGPDCNAFERELGQAIGAEHIVALNSGTSAVHLALIAAGAKPGDRSDCTVIHFLRVSKSRKISRRHTCVRRLGAGLVEHGSGSA